MDRLSSSNLLACLAVMAAASVAVTSAASGRSSNALTSGGVLTGCIDDSDCQKLGEGSKYACFLYICYPWKDDSGVPASEKRDLCRKKSDCSAKRGQTCQRHQDRRKINKGLCMNEVEDCDTPKDCPSGSGCCNGYCCEQRYFQQYKALPCVTHLGCQDLGLGQYCCPGKDNSTAAVCCDTNPNPTPPPPKTRTAGAATAALCPALLLAAAVLNRF